MNCIILVHYRRQWRAVINSVIKLQNCMNSRTTVTFSRTLPHGVSMIDYALLERSVHGHILFDNCRWSFSVK